MNEWLENKFRGKYNASPKSQPFGAKASCFGILQHQRGNDGASSSKIVIYQLFCCHKILMLTIFLWTSLFHIYSFVTIGKNILTVTLYIILKPSCVLLFTAK